jgi:arylsulfatase A-like enzyme
MNLPCSLVLVTVDCLRADHCSFLGYPRPTTPFLDSLAAQSLTFRNALAAGAPTYHAFPGIMASRYPLALGRDVVGVAPGEDTLATALSAAGFRTAAFIAGNPYLSQRFGYDAGFETFNDFLSAGPSAPEKTAPKPAANWRRNFAERLREFSQKAGPLGRLYDDVFFEYSAKRTRANVGSLDQLRRYPAADLIVNHASDWLAGTAAPFFLWLHLMDPHGPYYPPQPALQMMGQGGLDASQTWYLNSFWGRERLSTKSLKRHCDQLVELYDAGIRWVDTQVERLVTVLRDCGMWQNCVFAFTADHGEEFLEHDGRAHFPPKVTEELIHVPLLLHAPEMKKTGPAETPFSLIHLAPTLIEAAGASLPESFRGVSHWSILHDESQWKSPAITECIWNNPTQPAEAPGERILALREGNHKLVMDFRTSRDRLFDLKVDPGEMHPLPQSAEKPVRRRLLEQARAHLANTLAAADSGLRLGAELRELRIRYADVN